MGYSVGTTSLGPFRMGDSDGNAPPSAIYPNDIFAPLPARDRKENDVHFTSVGNRTFQPENDDRKLAALLKKFGDQQFKAREAQPFEEYFRIETLARQTEDAARFAGVAEQGQAREIMRNLVETRRQGNEDDYLRRMLGAGLSVEDAQMEVNNVRRASALQEAKAVDDRAYQAKLLISRITQARGGSSLVKDPFTQSASIANPQNSQEANLAMGQTGGFGSDATRQFVTPDFYQRFGRKMPESQETQDEQAAVNYLISQGGTSISNVAQLSGLERSDAILRQREATASKLETLRNRGNKIMLPLPPVSFFSESLLNQVYGSRKPGQETYFTTEDSQTLTNTQAIIAMNQLLSSDTTGQLYREAHQLLRASSVPIMKRDNTAGPNVFEILRRLVAELAGNGTIQLPFVSKTLDLSVASGNYNEVGKALENIRASSTPPGGAKVRVEAPVQARPAEPPRIAIGATAVPEGEGAASPSNAAAGPLPRDRASLPKVPSSLNMFLKLKKVGMDTLMEKYGLPIIGTRAEQYAALKAF
jgi:hypothetical protein